jgi:hypothetical protein
VSTSPKLFLKPLVSGAVSGDQEQKHLALQKLFPMLLFSGTDSVSPKQQVSATVSVRRKLFSKPKVSGTMKPNCSSAAA